MGGRHGRFKNRLTFEELDFEGLFFRYKKKIRFEPNGCWIWLGARGGNDCQYGRIYNQPVHRVFYERKYGKLPVGKEPHHKCKIKLCCNPEHMEVKTHRENCQEDLRKLSHAEELEIVNMYQGVGYTTYTLAVEYNVDRTTISNILRRYGVAIRGNRL